MPTPILQACLLIAEAIFVAGVILVLVRLRPRVGLIPLAAFVGSNQYLQTFLASTVFLQFGESHLVSPGSAVLFPSTLFAVLLVYHVDGIPSARALILGILLSNVTLTALAAVTALQVRLGGLGGIPAAALQAEPATLLASSVVLALDVLLLLGVYELLLGRWYRVPPVIRFPFTLLVVLLFDALVHVAIASPTGPDAAGPLATQLISKSLAGTIYGLLIFAHVRRVDPKERLRGDGVGTGPLAILTYRERYELLREQKKAQERAFEKERAVARALEQSERRYRTLVENSHDLIQLVATDGKLLLVNRAWKRTLGFDAADLANLDAFDVVHPRSRGTWTKTMDRLASGEDVGLVEVELMTRDGRGVEVEGSIARNVENGRLVSTLGIFRDATERKEVERLKDRFIATVSHELRTPVTSVYGSLDLVTDGKMGQVPPKVDRFLNVARRNAQRLMWLINDTLDFQKIESGVLELDVETHALGAVVDQAVEDNQGFASRFDVQLSRADDRADAVVRVDRQWLLQVLTNLLSNAVKHSPEGGTVDVSLVRRGGRVRVSVTDRGPGIPENLRDDIFQPFSKGQLTARAPEVGSTGLGLSIARALVERMGGTLDFETEVGAGTTFFFELDAVAGADALG
ncbi:MAG: ATP-binding protein [Acidobacteriota bacterium]